MAPDVQPGSSTLDRKVEFETIQLANEFRDQHPEALCSEDSRRTKTVTLSSDASQEARDKAAELAAASRSDKGEKFGQEPLTDAEKDALGPFTPPNHYAKAKSVKAIAGAYGVDFVSQYDPTISVEENKAEIKAQAGDQSLGDEVQTGATGTGAQRGGGANYGSDEQEFTEDDLDDRLAEMDKREAQACDHAKGHCKNGDPAACEFLTEDCGISEARVQALLSDSFGADDQADEDTDSDGLTGEQKGVLKRSWGGYLGAVEEVEKHLGMMMEALEDARGAFEAINAVRADVGQEPLTPERLEELDQSTTCDLTGEDLTAEGLPTEASQATIEIDRPEDAPDARTPIPERERLRSEELRGTGLSPEDLNRVPTVPDVEAGELPEKEQERILRIKSREIPEEIHGYEYQGSAGDSYGWSDGTREVELWTGENDGIGCYVYDGEGNKTHHGTRDTWEEALMCVEEAIEDHDPDHSHGDGGDSVITFDAGRQQTLGGGTIEEDQQDDPEQATFAAAEADPTQDRETRTAVEQGSLMADTRGDPDRGPGTALDTGEDAAIVGSLGDALELLREEYGTVDGGYAHRVEADADLGRFVTRSDSDYNIGREIASERISQNIWRYPIGAGEVMDVIAEEIPEDQDPEEYREALIEFARQKA